MSGVSEWIVREYFESLGYLVAQPRKYVVPGRQKNPDEEVDLVVFHPRIAEQRLPEEVVWTSDDLQTVSRAVVAVRGWHTERFYVSRFEQAPDILRFVEPAPVRFAEKLLGAGPMAKILCIPKLPSSGDIKEKSIKELKKKGVDGVISFETMLFELIAWVDTNRNYEKSDLLQVIRILKNYNFFREPQMELFGKGRRQKRSRGGATGEAKRAPDAKVDE